MKNSENISLVICNDELIRQSKSEVFRKKETFHSLAWMNAYLLTLKVTLLMQQVSVNVIDKSKSK